MSFSCGRGVVCEECTFVGEDDGLAAGIAHPLRFLSALWWLLSALFLALSFPVRSLIYTLHPTIMIFLWRFAIWGAV